MNKFSLLKTTVLVAVFIIGGTGAESFKTVNIGNQVWMAENLNVKTANAPSWCYYNNEKYCGDCGRLYTWQAALSACPSGWHLPNRKEWENVSKYRGFSYKTCGYRAVDWYGADQGFSYRGNTGAWWSSEENKKAWDGNEAYHWQVSTTGTGKLSEFPAPKGFGASVRCVADNPTPNLQVPNTNVGSTFVDTRDNKTYKTVKIGRLIWMAENVNHKMGGSWCYDDNESNCNKYGRLYTWMSAEYACPKGGHLPTQKEWTELALATGGSGWQGSDGPAGTNLKSKHGWQVSGTDKYGFSALPGGRRDASSDKFYSVGQEGGWWTAEKPSKNGFGLSRLLVSEASMDIDADGLNGYYYNMSDGLSVRCVIDE